MNDVSVVHDAKVFLSLFQLEPNRYGRESSLACYVVLHLYTSPRFDAVGRPIVYIQGRSNMHGILKHLGSLINEILPDRSAACG